MFDVELTYVQLMKLEAPECIPSSFFSARRKMATWLGYFVIFEESNPLYLITIPVDNYGTATCHLIVHESQFGYPIQGYAKFSVTLHPFF